MARAAKPKSKHSSSSSSHRKRKSDENDTPSSMKKTKLTLPTPNATQPKVTIRLKLGPRPPELEPFPCCLCISPSRDDLLPVHDKPILHHPAYVDTKVWMAHASCARVLPETWLDEVEVGPVLEDGTRKRENMVFGVDAIVKDRWNLVCIDPLCVFPQSADHVDVRRNVRRVPRTAPRCMARQSSAQGVNVRRLFTYPVRAKGKNMESSMRSSAKWRRTSCSWMCHPLQISAHQWMSTAAIFHHLKTTPLIRRMHTRPRLTRRPSK